MKNKKNLYSWLGTKKDKVTLIIGAKCKDGVILIADRKVGENGVTSVEDKIKFLPEINVVFSGSGLTDLFEKFLTRIGIQFNERKKEIIEKHIEKNPEGTSEPDIIRPYTYAEQFVQDCEGVLTVIREEYRDVIQKYQQGVEVLIAFRNVSEPELHLIDTFDCLDSKRNTYKAIGSGSPYASVFLNELWHENITMKEMAKLGHFIINYIEASELDSAVGKGVQIFTVSKLGDDALNSIEKEESGEKLSEEELESFKKYEIKEYKERLFEDSSNAKEIKECKEEFKNLAKKLGISTK